MKFLVLAALPALIAAQVYGPPPSGGGGTTSASAASAASSAPAAAVPSAAPGQHIVRRSLIPPVADLEYFSRL
jgi:hypothetical protein